MWPISSEVTLGPREVVTPAGPQHECLPATTFASVHWSEGTIQLHLTPAYPAMHTQPSRERRRPRAEEAPASSSRESRERGRATQLRPVVSSRAS